MQAFLVNQPNPKYNENLLNAASMLNDTAYPITVQSSGAGGSTAFYWIPKKLVGSRAIESLNYSKVTPLVWNLGSALDFTVETPGNYILQIQLNPEQDPLYPHQFNVKLFEDGNFIDKLMECVLIDNATGGSLAPFNYHTFAINFQLEASVDYSIQFEHIMNPDTTATYSAIFVGGLKLEKDHVASDGIPTAYSRPIL